MNSPLSASDLYRVVNLDERVNMLIHGVDQERPSINQSCVEIKLGKLTYFVSISLHTEFDDAAVRHEKDSRRLAEIAGMYVEAIVLNLKRHRSVEIRAVYLAATDGFEYRKHTCITPQQRKDRMMSRYFQVASAIVIGAVLAVTQAVRADDTVHVTVDPNKGQVIYCQNNQCFDEDTGDYWGEGNGPDGYYVVFPNEAVDDVSGAENLSKKDS